MVSKIKNETELSSVVTVKTSDGQVKYFRVPLDVQQAIQLEKQFNDDWQDILIGALVNFPTAKYNKEYYPIISTGVILGVREVDFQTIKYRLLPTRSQFLPSETWTKQTIFQNFNYLRHDFKGLSKLSIFIDLCHWKGIEIPFIRKYINKKIKQQGGVRH